MQDTLDLRVAPHEPVHVVATASALEGHVKRQRRVVVFCPQRQVPRQTAKPSILSSASARAWVARMINIVQPPRRRAVEPRGQRRVDGMHFTTSSVCHKLGRVPTTYKQSAGAESLLRPEVPATGRHFESLLFSTHIARTSSKPSQNRVIASAMARSVFAKIVSLSTADLLPPRAHQETLAPYS